MISTDNTVNSTITYNTCSCVHRLPCGYCPLLNRSCPMQGITITNTPAIVYCNTSGSTGGVTANET